MWQPETALSPDLLGTGKEGWWQDGLALLKQAARRTWHGQLPALGRRKRICPSLPDKVQEVSDTSNVSQDYLLAHSGDPCYQHHQL